MRNCGKDLESQAAVELFEDGLDPDRTSSLGLVGRGEKKVSPGGVEMVFNR